MTGYHLDCLENWTDTSGGGVCIYLKSTIPSKYLDYCDQSGVESLWVSARPHKLPKQITSIVLAVIYHSTRIDMMKTLC